MADVSHTRDLHERQSAHYCLPRHCGEETNLTSILWDKILNPISFHEAPDVEQDISDPLRLGMEPPAKRTENLNTSQVLKSV